MKWPRQSVHRTCHEKYPEFAKRNSPGRSSPNRIVIRLTEQAGQTAIKQGRQGGCKVESWEFDPCTAL